MDFNALQDVLAPKGNASDDIKKHYSLVEEIGHGAYGVVWKAVKKNASKDVFAVKHIDAKKAGSKGMQEVMGEVETMTLLSHPNIVHLEETFRTPSSLWIVMEFLPGGTLEEFAGGKGLTEPTVRRMVVQLLMALEYIHDKGIVHRDLKPANCLLSANKMTLKISDFGFSVLTGTEQCLTNYCGTVAYMAPEILGNKNYGKPVDMWALGVMTYFLFAQEFPFEGKNSATMTSNICHNRNRTATSEKLMQFPMMRDFIMKLLVPDPNERLSAKEALTHPWIKSALDVSRRASYAPSRRPTVTRRHRSALARLRRATVAIMAAHRLRYWQQLRRLARHGYDRIHVLRDFHYLVTGTYSPPGDTVQCRGAFATHPLAVEELLPMVASCPYIRHLDLSHNNIDNFGTVQNLLRLAGKHPGMRSINLSHNPIPALAGRGLLRLARNPLCHIRRIDIEATGISHEVAAQIQASLRERAAGSASTHDMGSSLVGSLESGTAPPTELHPAGFHTRPSHSPPASEGTLPLSNSTLRCNSSATGVASAPSSSPRHPGHLPPSPYINKSAPPSASTSAFSRSATSEPADEKTITGKKRRMNPSRLPPLPQAAVHRKGRSK